MRRLLVRAWAAPVSLAALPFAAAAALTGGECRRRGGVLESCGGVLAPILARGVAGFSADAITLGHVVLARDMRSLERTRGHERVHVRQYERWGALFPLLYLASSAAALLRGASAYRDNAFEREAFSESEGARAA